MDRRRGICACSLTWLQTRDPVCSAVLCVCTPHSAPRSKGFPMAIKVGDSLPETTFMTMSPEGPKPAKTAEVFGGKKVALFAVPGAYTPTCHKQHMAGFVERYD